MQNAIAQIKNFVYKLNPNQIRTLATVLTIIGGVVICSPGAGSGIGG